MANQRKLDLGYLDTSLILEHTVLNRALEISSPVWNEEDEVLGDVLVDTINQLSALNYPSINKILEENGIRLIKKENIR